MAESLPPDASTASTGLGIRYIGNYCYGYSGTKNGSSSFVDYLNFITGAGVIKGRLYDNGSPNPDDPSAGGESISRVTFNGAIIAYQKVSTNSPDNNPGGYNDFIIPPFTHVEVAMRTLANSAFQGNFVFVGRVYDA